MKTYAIGDLHGRLDLLEQALMTAAKHCGDEGFTFVVCGDFIDRGPDSAGIIRTLRHLQETMNIIVLMGNHENMMLSCLSGENRLGWWVGNGGGTTLQSYGYAEGDTLIPLKIPEGDLRWLAELPIYHLDEHRAFVHAGFDSSQPIELQNPQHMMWMRAPREQDYSFEGRHVVHGHEQYADGPVLNPNKSNLDTFAWASGRLAIAVFDDAIPGGPTEVLWAEGEPSPQWAEWSKEEYA